MTRACLNKLGIREASKPMAWYANILTSLAVESGDGGHQQIIGYFLEYKMNNFFIKEMLNSSNIKKQCGNKSHAGLNK